MITFGAWIALFLIVQAVLTVVQYFTARKPVKLPVRIVLILAKALIAAAFALLVMAGPVFLRPVQAVLTAVYAALLPDAGAAGWRFPFRTEAHCAFEVVDLLPAGN
jgi:hypothetical protein